MLDHSWLREIDPHAISSGMLLLAIAAVTCLSRWANRVSAENCGKDRNLNRNRSHFGVSKGETCGGSTQNIPAPIVLGNTNDQIEVCCGLYVHDNIGDDGAKEVAKMIFEEQASATITELDLYSNQIGPKGARHLGLALASPLPMVAQTLLHHRLQHECASIVASFFRSLKSLNLDNNLVGDSGAQALSEALKDHPRLEFLSLCDNGIGDAGASAVMALLRTSRSLRVLRLGNNNINGKRPLLELAGILSGNSSLQVLCLEGNNIGAEGAEEIATMLRKNTSLEELNLRKCCIGTIGAVAIADALKTSNRTLRILSLDGNGIGEEGALEFIDAMEKNRVFRSLSISSGNNFSSETLLKLAVLRRKW